MALHANLGGWSHWAGLGLGLKIVKALRESALYLEKTTLLRRLELSLSILHGMKAKTWKQTSCMAFVRTES